MRQGNGSFRITFAWCLVTGILATVSACGFHLRGAVVLPPELQQIALQGTPPAGALAVEIRNALEVAGGKLVASTGNADSVIVITRDAVEQTVLSVNPAGQASEYQLHYQLGFRLEAPDGRPRVPAQAISLYRQYEFNPATVLAKSDQQADLTRQMRRAAVNQMLQRLAASLRHSPSPASRPDPVHAPAP